MFSYRVDCKIVIMKSLVNMLVLIWIDLVNGIMIYVCDIDYLLFLSVSYLIIVKSVIV